MVKVSVLGLYNENPHLFDGLNLPGEWSLSKENCVNQILLQCACFEILYPDPVFLQDAIAIWSTTQNNVWSKFAETLILQYNPIHNYDRTETETISRTGTGTQQITNTGNDENQVSAFNASTYQPERKVVYNSGNSSETEAENSESRTTHISGNIGVTTTQEMIKAQREIIDATIQQYIVDDFKHKFCILVY